MRTITQYVRPFAALLLAVAALLVAITVFRSYNSVSPPKPDAVLSESIGAPTGGLVARRDTAKVEIFKDDAGLTHARTENKPVQATEALTKYAVDTLVPAYKIALEQIVELTRLNAVLSGKLKASYAVRDTTTGNTRTYYPGIYMNAYTNSVDSTMDYRYNADITVAIYDALQPFLSFRARKSWLEALSPDSNWRFSGMQRYKRLVPRPKDKLWVSAVAESGWGLDPIVLRNLSAGLEMRVNPDGVLSGYVGAGYAAPVNQNDGAGSNRAAPYGRAGVAITPVKW